MPRIPFSNLLSNVPIKTKRNLFCTSSTMCSHTDESPWKKIQSSPLTHSTVQNGSIVPGEYRFKSHAVPCTNSQILPSLLSNTLSNRHRWNSTWLSDDYVTICSNAHLHGIIQDILRYLRGKSSFVENTNVIAPTSHYNSFVKPDTILYHI